MNYLPDILSLTRIFVAIVLIFFRLETTLTVLLIVICILTDIFDGFIARRLKAESERGVFLDTLGDIVFGTALLLIILKFYPRLISGYILIFIVVAIIRLTSVTTAFVKAKKIIMLHTIGNKITGLLIITGLILYIITGREFIIGAVYITALISAVEEFLIVIISKKTSPDIKGFWQLKNQ